MYDFASGFSNDCSSQNLSISELEFDAGDGGVKVFHAVVNIAQDVKIKVTDQETSSITAETPEFEIRERVRQYTTSYTNDDVNTYDNYINFAWMWWGDWDLGDPPYTFAPDTRPDKDLIKAVGYKETSLKPANGPNMMKVLTIALNGMTVSSGTTERDINASASVDEDGCFLLAEGAPFMNYSGPSASTAQDSFVWGTRYLMKVKNRNQVGPCAEGYYHNNPRTWPEALFRYGDEAPDYDDKVMGLWKEGKNPNGSTPLYLWPVLADGCPNVDYEE